MTCDSLKVVDGMSKFTRRSRRSVSLSSSNKTEGRCWCSLIIISLLLSSSRFRYFCFAPPHTFARSLLVFIRSHPLDPTREDQAAKLRTLLAFLLERVKEEGPKKNRAEIPSNREEDNGKSRRDPRLRGPFGVEFFGERVITLLSFVCYLCMISLFHDAECILAGLLGVAKL